MPKAADLLGIDAHAAAKFSTGERRTPPEVIRRCEILWMEVERAARALVDKPELVPQARIAPYLRRAVYRRIQEMNIMGGEDRPTRKVMT